MDEAPLMQGCRCGQCREDDCWTPPPPKGGIYAIALFTVRDKGQPKKVPIYEAE